MKRVLSLVMVLGVAALFSSAALAGADCSYHKTQAAVEKSDGKEMATAPTPDKADPTQVKTAEAAPQAPQSTAAPKK